MHQNLTFLVLADHNSLSSKLDWVEKLVKFYQNSTAIVTLICADKLNHKMQTTSSCKVIHYPANRNIDAHLLMIQTAKTLNHSPLYYLHNEPPDKPIDFAQNELKSYGPLAHEGRVFGFYLDYSSLSKLIKTDLNTVNLIRGAMLEAGIN